MLVGVMKLAKDNPTLESSEIEKNNTPQIIKYEHKN
jgi:multicomponent Na+:H+ antiporter subunit C